MNRKHNPFPVGMSKHLDSCLAVTMCRAMAYKPVVLVDDAEDLELAAVHGTQGIDLIALAMTATMREFDKLEEPSLADQMFIKALLTSAERVSAEADQRLVITLAPRTELVTSIPVDHHLQGGWSL